MCLPNNSAGRPPALFARSSFVLLPLTPVVSSYVGESEYPSTTNENEKPTVTKRKRVRKPQKPGKTANNHNRRFVVHNYHDHAQDAKVQLSAADEAALATTFPTKLHELLEQANAAGLSHIVSWKEHGRCFVIHDPKAFATHIMPRYVSFYLF